MKSSKEIILTSSDLYDNRLIRTLIRLIPGGYGGAIDMNIMKTIETIREERLKTFFDELAKGNLELDEETINSESFLHSYFCTAKSMLNTARREKIVLLARFFSHHISTNSFNDVDEYEFYFKILDDLSYQELSLLMRLVNFEKQYPIDSEDLNSRLTENKKFWQEFIRNIIDEHEISSDEINGMLIRITRTGCLHYPSRASNDYRPISAASTPLFRNLLEKIIQ